MATEVRGRVRIIFLIRQVARPLHNTFTLTTANTRIVWPSTSVRVILTYKVFINIQQLFYSHTIITYSNSFIGKIMTKVFSFDANEICIA